MKQEEIVSFYQNLADQIPNDWYGEAELLKAAQPMLNHLKKSLNSTVAEAASKAGKSEDEFQEALMETAKIFGKLNIFKYRFPEIIKQLPQNPEGKGILPTNILARVLNVSENDAIEIAQLYFGKDSEVAL